MQHVEWLVRNGVERIRADNEARAADNAGRNERRQRSKQREAATIMAARLATMNERSATDPVARAIYSGESRTREEIDAALAAFLQAGGKIEQVEIAATGYTTDTVPLTRAESLAKHKRAHNKFFDHAPKAGRGNGGRFVS